MARFRVKAWYGKGRAARPASIETWEEDAKDEFSLYSSLGSVGWKVVSIEPVPSLGGKMGKEEWIALVERKICPAAYKAGYSMGQMWHYQPDFVPTPMTGYEVFLRRKLTSMTDVDYSQVHKKLLDSVGGDSKFRQSYMDGFAAGKAAPPNLNERDFFATVSRMDGRARRARRLRGCMVQTVYDPGKRKIRVVGDDGVHGKGWVAFPNTLRTAEGLRYEVPDLRWNGRNYIAIGKPSQVYAGTEAQRMIKAAAASSGNAEILDSAVRSGHLLVASNSRKAAAPEVRKTGETGFVPRKGVTGCPYMQNIIDYQRGGDHVRLTVTVAHIDRDTLRYGYMAMSNGRVAEGRESIGQPLPAAAVRAMVEKA